MNRRLRLALRLGALATAAALSACEDSGVSHRSLSPIPSETLALMEKVETTKEAPTLIRAYKKEAEFEVWKMGAGGRYVHLKTYPICRWSGQLGPKTREGDRQAPEGFYSISPAQLNPNSAYYLSFNVGYPNAVDRSLGHTGGTIMVHGACSSAGCFSMSDRQIAEIYAITRTSLNAGQRSVQMQSYPFHMTAENLAQHRLDPHIDFWKNLKEGSDYFEVTKHEPRVAACGRRYVFEAEPANGQSLDASSPCPTLKYEPETRAQIAEKAAKDEAKVVELAASGVKPVRLVDQDGGQHPDFAARIADVSRPETLVPPVEIALDEKSNRKSMTKLAAKAPLVKAPAKFAAKRQNAPDAAAPAVARVSTAPTTVADASATQMREWISLHKPKESEAASLAAKSDKLPPTSQTAKKSAKGAVKQALREPATASAKQ